MLSRQEVGHCECLAGRKLDTVNAWQAGGWSL